jgi:pimeloyl-ACP methyl ester carboxylesterase
MQQGTRELSIEANGLVHHVVEWGEPEAREVVVLCHGFLDLAWGFAALAPKLLAPGRRILAFDWRGHGETEWLGRGGYYHFPDYVLDLHCLLPQLTDEPVHLVGHSMGGTVSIYYAASHPERIRTLSLLEGMGPPAAPPEGALGRLKAWLSGVDGVRADKEATLLPDLETATKRLKSRNPDVEPELLRFLAEKATAPHPRGQGLTWRFDPLHKTLSPLPFDAQRFRYFLEQIKVPTLIVDGEKGMRSGAENERIPLLQKAHTASIPSAGHMMQWTHAEETAALLREHFARSP